LGGAGSNSRIAAPGFLPALPVVRIGNGGGRREAGSAAFRGRGLPLVTFFTLEPFVGYNGSGNRHD